MPDPRTSTPSSMCRIVALLLTLSATPLAAQSSGGVIRGTVTDDVGFSISGSSVVAFDVSGTPVGAASTGPTGEYEIGDVPVGTTFLVASAAGHASELWEDLPCEGCDPTTGTPVAVVAGMNGPYDFDLDRVAVVEVPTLGKTGLGILAVLLTVVALRVFTAARERPARF